MVGEFDIAGAPLKETLAVVATNHKTVTHWERLGNAIVFYWSNPSMVDVVPLPGPMNVIDCEGFIKSALTAIDYPSEPDCDGHCTKSWRIRNRINGAVLSPYTAFVVSPHWNEYHK